MVSEERGGGERLRLTAMAREWLNGEEGIERESGRLMGRNKTKAKKQQRITTDELNLMASEERIINQWRMMMMGAERKERIEDDTKAEIQRI